MKKILLATLALVSALTVFADDTAILDKIEKSNTAYKSLSASFTEVKTNIISGNKTNYAGMLYYVSPSQFSQIYTKPATDVFVINNSQLYMVRSTKKVSFDLSKNVIMRSLSNTLLYCLQGKVRKLATENNANIALSVSKDGKYDVVTLTSNKKVARGYKKIVLYYAKSDNKLYSMQMDEVSGNSSLYTMTNYKANETIAPAKFAIPKK